MKFNEKIIPEWNYLWFLGIQPRIDGAERKFLNYVCMLVKFKFLVLFNRTETCTFKELDIIEFKYL